MFTCSVSAKLFTVNYYLRVYVKHDAWNEFFKGPYVSQPIKIMLPPPQQQIVANYEEYQKPQDWNPVVMGEVVLNENST